MLFARRNLTKEKTRLALSVLGVALAIMLILLLNGMVSGMNRQITSYLDHSPGSLIVAQQGVENLLGATSLLPRKTAAQVADLDGVAESFPILSQYVILDLHGEKLPVYLVGSETGRQAGAWDLAAGHQPQRDDEMVVDRIWAEQHGLEIGESIDMMGETFVIVGLSEGTTSWMTGFVFIRKSSAEALFRLDEGTSFLLIAAREGTDLQVLRRDLDGLGRVQVLTKEEMAANDLELFAGIFSAPIRLMAGIAFLVGALVVGLIMYTDTLDRQVEYGLLKAVGANNSVLYRVVGLQALIAALTGSISGLLLAYAAAGLIEALKPQFLVVIEPGAMMRTLLIGAAMALLAALYPARMIGRMPPSEVFRR